MAADVLLNHAALRATDKLDKLVALGRFSNLGLGLIATRLIVQLALEQDTAGVVNRLNLLGSEATTR